MNRNLYDHNYLNFCPCCESNKNKTILKITKENSSFRKLSKERYQGILEEITPDKISIEIRVCNSCNHHWYPWTPKEDQLMEMYNKHIRKNGKKLNFESKKKKYINKELEDQINFLNHQSITLLDYGSGLGVWTDVAIAKNLITYAFEPSANRRSEADLRNLFVINDLKNINKVFDLVNFEQVLEHVIDPQKALTNIIKFLSPNSIVRIRVPNINRSKEGPNFNKEWPYSGYRMHTLSPYEHLHGFTQDSLSTLCRKSGLKIYYKFVILKKPFWLLRYYLGKLNRKFSTTTIYCKKV